MESKTVHLHYVTRKTNENLLLLLIPILVFLLALTFIVARSEGTSMAENGTGSAVLGGESQTP